MRKVGLLLVYLQRQIYYDALGLSARAHDRILRVARTVADLAGKQLLDEDCVLEALQYRAQEKVEV